MKRAAARWGAWALVGSIMAALAAAPAAAQTTFDPDNYRALAPASSPATIAPGTRITTRNWRAYRQFLPLALQVELSGQSFWKIGDGPEWAIEVAPTEHFAPPQQYRRDTERYAGQASLTPLPGGGRLLAGYVAGVPFPNPQGPQAGDQLMYDAWLGFAPFVLDFKTIGFTIDRFMSVNRSLTRITFYRLSHLSEPGMPVSMSYADGYLSSSRAEQIIPENSRYTTILALQPDDPRLVQEIFTYIPTLRRSVRLSSSARCSPLLGSDYVQDDNGDGFYFQLAKFSARLLGEKKLLVDVMAPGKASDLDSFIIQGSTQGRAPGWPRADAAKWELRDLYIIDIQPLDDPTYCYPHKVVYLDKESWVHPRIETYDINGRLWKLLHHHMYPQTLNGERVLMAILNPTSVLDFQNDHATVAIPDKVDIGSAVAPEYRNAELMAFPGSLSRVMQ